ncbi:MAG: DUF4397 domain-containing protein [Gemmatimonadota bacterium]
MRRIAAVLLVALAFGCGESAGGPFIIGGGGTGATRIRFFHAVADGPNLQLLKDGQTDLGEIGFGSITPYVQIDQPGVQLTLQSALSVTPIADTNVTLPDTSLITVIAEGPDSAIQLRFIVDGRASIDTSLIKIRVLHEAFSGGPLDVYITAPLADLTTATPTVAGLDFGEATAYSVLLSGTYQVRLTTAGTKTVVIDSGSLPLDTADVRTIMVVEATGGGLPLGSILVRDAGT